MDQLPGGQSESEMALRKRGVIAGGIAARLPEVVAALAKGNDDVGDALARFSAEPDLLGALQLWFGPGFDTQELADKHTLKCRITSCLAAIDQLLNSQLNAVIHHPAFQRLEASWRGLVHLVAHNPDGSRIKIRVLHSTWQELARDADRAIEFDQTHLFREVYEGEFGMPGGEPFGLLLVDFPIRHRPSSEHPFDDLRVMESLSQVAAAAFAPLITSAHPALLGLDRFAGLERRLDLGRIFSQVEYRRWNAFRATEDARFMGMVLPRVLMRTSYRACTARADRFPFVEECRGADARGHLWGSAVYAFGAAVMRTFAATGWFERIVGNSRDGLGSGVVEDLPVPSFDTEAEGVATKFSLEVLLTGDNEREFADWGLIPLTHCKYTDLASFEHLPSLHRAPQYDRPAAARNSELSTKLNLMLCVSRFAHYVKVIARDRIGSFTTPAELEDHLHRWIHQYVSADANMAPEVRVRYPLREASIRVRELPDKPGTFLCTAHLRPHLQGEQPVALLKLVTEVASVRSVSRLPLVPSV